MTLRHTIESLDALADHLQGEMRKHDRSPESRGMRNPHDAYVTGYNTALDDVADLLRETVIMDPDG